MHELGVTFRILDMVEATALENEMTKIEEIVLELGEVSTVVEAQLQSCFKWSVKKRGLLLEEAKLTVETIPALSVCDDCGTVFGTVVYGKTCPVCSGNNTFLQQGNEFKIKEIHGF